VPISKGQNGKYYVKVWKDKKLYTPAKMGMSETSWATRSAAKKAEVMLREMIEHLKSSTKVTRLDLLSLCNHYLRNQEGKCVGHDTFPKKKRFSKEIIKEWGKDTAVQDITPFMVNKYLSKRAKEFSNNSFNSYRKEGVAMWNWAIKMQLLPPNTVNVFAVIDKLAHSTGGPKPAPLEAVKKVLSVANQEQYDLIMAYVLTAARKNELLTMTWNDVDMEKRTYKLRTMKTGNRLPKVTLHSMADGLFEIFQRRDDKRHPEVEYVFWHRYWSLSLKDYIEDRYMSLNKFTARLCKKADVDHFSLHQLRHLAASILKKKGASLAEMQLFLRHDEQKTTEIYAGHLDNSTEAQSKCLGDFWREQLSC
jgi:integrase